MGTANLNLKHQQLPLANLNLKHQQLPLSTDFPILQFPRSACEVHVGYWLNEQRMFSLNQILGCCPGATDVVLDAIQSEISLERAEAAFLRQVAAVNGGGKKALSSGDKKGASGDASSVLPYSTNDRILAFDALLATIVVDHAMEELFSHLKEFSSGHANTNFFKFYTDWTNRAGALCRFVRDLFEKCFSHSARLQREDSKNGS